MFGYAAASPDGRHGRPERMYARDFWAPSVPNDVEEPSSVVGEGYGDVPNVDRVYVTEDMEEGTLLFRKPDTPEIANFIDRSNNHPTNCEVVELEDGSGAMVSCGPIAAGEFLCISKEDGDENEDEDEED